MLAFTGHAVLAVDESVPDERLDDLGADGYGGASDPRLITALAGPGGWIDSLDAVLVSCGPISRGPIGRGLGGDSMLVPRPDLAGHPRVRHAEAVRADVRVFGPAPGEEGAGAVVILARGLGGLPELSIELLPQRRGGGLGRRLIAAAGLLVPAGEPLVASVAPGNAASLRAFLATGFTPVASVVLWRPGTAALTGS